MIRGAKYTIDKIRNHGTFAVENVRVCKAVHLSTNKTIQSGLYQSTGHHLARFPAMGMIPLVLEEVML